jgi:hypothetical protein
MPHWREPCEQCGQRSYCPHYPAAANSFPGRVALAAQCIRSGDGTGSRAYDNCFEMWDGDYVMLTLVRMAQADQPLAAGIDREWSRSGGLAGKALWAQRFAHLSDDDIPVAAARVRKAERERSQAQIAAWRAGTDAPSQLALI